MRALRLDRFARSTRGQHAVVSARSIRCVAQVPLCEGSGALLRDLVVADRGAAGEGEAV